MLSFLFKFKPIPHPECQPHNSQTKVQFTHRRAGPAEARPAEQHHPPTSMCSHQTQRLGHQGQCQPHLSSRDKPFPAAATRLTLNSKSLRRTPDLELFPAAWSNTDTHRPGLPEGPRPARELAGAAVIWAARPVAATSCKASCPGTLAPISAPLCAQSQGCWGSNSSVRAASPRPSRHLTGGLKSLASKPERDAAPLQCPQVTSPELGLCSTPRSPGPHVHHPGRWAPRIVGAP